MVSVDTGDELAAFSGSDDQDASGSRSSGTTSVDLTPEGDAVIATDADGTKQRVELPASMRVVDHGKGVEIAWRDGRVERRERAPVFKVSKYGDVYRRPLVDPPESDAPGSAKAAKKR